jgi:hypothetical protein
LAHPRRLLQRRHEIVRQPFGPELGQDRVIVVGGIARQAPAQGLAGLIDGAQRAGLPARFDGVIAVARLLGADPLAPEEPDSGDLGMQHAAVDADPLQRHAAGKENVAEPAQKVLGGVRQAADAQEPVNGGQGRGIGKAIHLRPIIEAGRGGVKTMRLQP